MENLLKGDITKLENKDKKKDIFTDKDFLATVNRQTNESFQEEKFAYQKTDYKKWIIQFIIIAIAAVAAYLLINQKVEVIDFTHMSYQDVAAWASDKDVIITVDNKYSSEVNTDHVISQSIQPGEEVKSDTNIIVVVSEGLDPYEKITLPDFDSTWNKTSIQRWLTQNGIENFAFRNEESTDIEGGYLISYRLIGAAEEDFMRSSEIKFTVSATDNVETVMVGNFLNSTLLEADIWAKHNEVSYTCTYDFSLLYDRDRIISQSIVPGEEMDVDETISFIVSKGEEITVPSFSNKSIDEVGNYAQDIGISVEVVELYSAGTKVGDFISQSISSGEMVEEDTIITVRYSLGGTITVPNYTNGLKVDFEEWVREINEMGASIVLTIKEDSDNSLEYGRIISQNIYNENVGLSTNIELLVSSGGEIKVPSFSDISANEAQNHAQDSGISAQVVESYATGTKEGDFISQSISSGEMVEEDTIITVHYSLGDTINVLNYTNQLRVDFEEWVREQNEMGANITLTVYEDYEAGIEYGRIISQNVYNENVGLSTNIELLVSLGEAYTVLNFYGLSRNQIQSYAEQNGLTIVFEEVADSGLASGRFISQEPASGEVISKRDFIKIQVAQ